jgi:hypothetical protein
VNTQEDKRRGRGSDLFIQMLQDVFCEHPLMQSSIISFHAISTSTCFEAKN